GAADRDAGIRRPGAVPARRPTSGPPHRDASRAAVSTEIAISPEPERALHDPLHHVVARRGTSWGPTCDGRPPAVSLGRTVPGRRRSVPGWRSARAGRWNAQERAPALDRRGPFTYKPIRRCTRRPPRRARRRGGAGRRVLLAPLRRGSRRPRREPASDRTRSPLCAAEVLR